jgi:hypothetical protein
LKFFTEADCDCVKATVYYPGTRMEGGTRVSAISLDKANHLIQERGKVVYGLSADGDWMNEAHHDSSDTHCALLINVEPIERPDTAELLLRDLIVKLDCGIGITDYEYANIKDRARKFLEGK